MRKTANANVIMDESGIIKGIERMIEGKGSPVIALDKKDYSALILKEIITTHYGNTVEIKEDKDAYHIHFIKPIE